MAEFRVMSLRECAMADCMRYGASAVEDYKKRLRMRKYNKKPGVKTNVGDPNRSGNFTRKVK